MYLRFLCIIASATHIVRGFVPHHFGAPFHISAKERNKPIVYDLPKEDVDVIKNVNGFYGLIGPDVNTSSVESLYELFTGNGNIQGVFLDNGQIQYVKHMVRTDKILYEETNGQLPVNVEAVPFFECMNKLGIFPSTMNLANTALMYINQSLYALFERDLPILLRLDFANKTLDTVGVQQIKGIDHFSAHSLYDPTKKILETVDYNVFNNRIKYACLNETFHIINETTVETTYLPVIHDFITRDETVVFMDSPLVVKLRRLFHGKMPVIFNPTLPTYLYVLNKTDMTHRRYKTNRGMYIFHYADMTETDEDIFIYGSIYRDLDMACLNIKGCYSLIHIDKVSGKVETFTTPQLEKANLDFPIRWGDDKVILRNAYNRGANQFVICRKLDVLRTIDLKNRNICGEPALVQSRGRDYLIFFVYDAEYNGYLTLVDLLADEKRIEIALNTKMGIGFHSIFVPRPNNSYNK